MKTGKTANAPEKIIWPYVHQETTGKFDVIIDSLAALAMVSLFWLMTIVMFGIMP